MNATGRDGVYQKPLLGRDKNSWSPVTSRTEHESKSAQEKLEHLHSKVKEYQDLVSQRGETLSATDYNQIKAAHSAVKRVQVGLQEQVDPSNRKSGEAEREVYSPGDTQAEKAATKMRNVARITEQLVEKAPSHLKPEVNDKAYKAIMMVEKFINDLKNKVSA
jgi:hypothetical protein